MGITLSQVPQQDIENITYSQLDTAITNSTLIPTKLYAITDYQTKYWVYDSSSVLTSLSGPTEAIIVLAVANNKIDKQVYSADYPDDTIYYDRTDPNSPLGRIYMRRYEPNNLQTPFDFRAVKFRRYQYGAETTGHYTLPLNTLNTVGLLMGVPSTGSFEDYFVFGGLIQNLANFKNVVIGPLGADFIALNSIDDKERENIVFLDPATGRVENVEIGGNNLRNTFYAVDVFDVKIGHSAINNRFVCPTNTVTIGNNASNNNIACVTMFSENNIGDYFNTNSFTGTLVKKNKIEDHFNTNGITVNFQRNTIASNFNTNTVSAVFEDNQILRQNVGVYTWGVSTTFRKLDIDYSNIESTIVINNGISTNLDLTLYPYTGIFYVQAPTNISGDSPQTLETITVPPSHPYELRPIINSPTNLEFILSMNGAVTEGQLPNGLSLATDTLTLKSLKNDWVKLRRIGALNVQVDGQVYR